MFALCAEGLCLFAVIQLTISIYTFFRYFEYTDFLYLGQSEVSFHGQYHIDGVKHASPKQRQGARRIQCEAGRNRVFAVVP